MPKYSVGLTSFKIGDIAVDGGLGTSLADVGSTVKGSMTLSSSEAQTQDFFIEEDPTAPIMSVVTEYPALTLEGECYDILPATAAKLLGGTVSTTGTGPTTKSVYTPPANPVPIEVSAELTTDSGVVFKIVRLQIIGRFEWQMTDEELGKIAFTAKALKPTKAATAAYTYEVPTPA